MTQQTQRVDLLFPVGRIVGGSISKGQTTDYEGRPLVYKNGDKAGQPRSDFSFGIAVAKVPGKHWGAEGGTWGDVGKRIWEFGHAAWGQIAQNRDFSWKVQDGDSTDVNKKGNRACDREGFPGHWIFWFSGSTRPKLTDAKGQRYLTEEEIDAIKAGWFVQVYGNVDSNKSQGNPGLYLNHNIVAFSGTGPEIQLGVDISAVGFGSAPTPAGMGEAPAGMTAAPGVAQAAAAPAPPVASNVAATTPPPPATTAVQPHAAILNAGAAAPAPPAAGQTAPPPPVAAGPQMTAAANGVSYEAYKASGWSDEQLRAGGLMI